MGLLDSIQRRNEGTSIPDSAYFEFKCMDEELRSKILAIYKRLFIRGVLGAESEYSSKNNIYLHDKSQNIIFYQHGYFDKEEYYCLMIEDEMWRVTVVKKSDRQYKHLEVIYIPNKVGKVSNYDEKAEIIAKQAVHLFLSEDYDYYIEKLKTVFDHNLLEENIFLPDTWYQLLLQDENCRQLLEYKESLVENQASQVEEINYLLEFSNEETVEYLAEKTANKVISREHVLKPGIMRTMNLSILRYLNSKNSIRCHLIMKWNTLWL